MLLGHNKGEGKALEHSIIGKEKSIHVPSSECHKLMTSILGSLLLFSGKENLLCVHKIHSDSLFEVCKYYRVYRLTL